MTRPDFADERGIIGSFFIKLFVVLAVAGVIVADGASIVFARVRADDAATSGATACAVNFRANKNAQLATDAAVRAAEEKAPGVIVTGVATSREGYCTVSTRDTATTLVVSRVGFLKGLGEVTASETARPPTF